MELFVLFVEKMGRGSLPLHYTHTKLVIPAKRREALREPGPTMTMSQWVPDHALARRSGMTAEHDAFFHPRIIRPFWRWWISIARIILSH
jgi:hypothetical protein